MPELETDMSANSLDFACDWQLGLNLRPDRHGAIGYLLGFNGCGGLRLKPDIEVYNPFDDPGQTVVSGALIKCVGLIESFRFEGGEEDPIRIRAFVSKGTAADIRAKLARPMANTTAKLDWYILDFDTESKLWFEAAFVKRPAQAAANIDSTGGDLQMFIANEPTRISETLDIGVYAFELQVVPADKKKTTLEFATGPRRRLVKQWG